MRAGQGETHLPLKQHTELLRALLKLYPLTGIANRLSLVEPVAFEWRRAMRTQNPLSLLMMIDVDFLKAYNDCYGHRKGDAIQPSGRSDLTSAADLFNRADVALYAAKNGGRNRIVLHPDSR